jgi:aspartate racemase
MADGARRTVGVMGGMGPDATVDFMTKVIALTDSGRDQDHVHMLVDHDPTVPNRQLAISSGVDDVSQRLADMACRLESAGADFLVMVCNTAHVFMSDALDATSIPFISIIDESVGEIERLCPAARKVGVMATDGCIETSIYQGAISASGRTALIPDSANMSKLMKLINAIKAGDQSDEVVNGMESVAHTLVDAGAEVIIAGCTEIPIVFEGVGFPVPVVASTNVLARRTVEIAMGRSPLPNNPI